MYPVMDTHRFVASLLKMGGVLLLLPVMLASAASGAAEKPNIVIIVADDLGWADVSFHGTEIKTPKIDSLAAGGAVLDRFYVCPVCSPTRAGLMTGRYPIRYGSMRAVYPPWRSGGLDIEEVTIADALGRAGYEHRGIFGKWHLGHSSLKYHPLRRGFTEFIGHYNGAIDYFSHEREGELDWHRDYEPNHDEGYSTDLIADAAVDFINRHAKETAPFFCYVPFNAPHGPLQAKSGDLETYEHLAAGAAPQGRNRANTPREGYGQRGRGQTSRQTLAAMIAAMDQGVGRILDALDENEIADDTLVWFFSDNGGVGTGDNGPLRGQKGTVFEGGIRVAAAIRWPGHVPASSKVTAPLAYIDVLPTLMRIVALDDHGGKPLDGRDMLGVLTGQESGQERALYSYIGQQGEDDEQMALTEGAWKLVVTGPNLADASADRGLRDTYLFRIVEDPYEANDVAGKHPEVVRRMFEKLERFRALQPADAVPPYNFREGRFTAPKEWKIPEN